MVMNYLFNLFQKELSEITKKKIAKNIIDCIRTDQTNKDYNLLYLPSLPPLILYNRSSINFFIVRLET